MRVEYRINNMELVFQNDNIKNYFENWLVVPYELPLTVGREYTVYGIEFTEEGYERFYVLDDSGIIYPSSYPKEFFEITDNRISKFWSGSRNRKLYPITIKNYPEIITFNEWRNDRFFEGELLNNSTENEVFERYQKKMDVEFSNPNSPSAIEIDNTCCLCYSCGNLIELQEGGQGLVECCSCLLIQNTGFL